MGHALGDAGDPTTARDSLLQTDALTAAGCAQVWTDVASGGRDDRPELAPLLERQVPGDTVVWRLDRLGRSLPHLLATTTEPEGRGCGP